MITAKRNPHTALARITYFLEAHVSASWFSSDVLSSDEGKEANTSFNEITDMSKNSLFDTIYICKKEQPTFVLEKR